MYNENYYKSLNYTDYLSRSSKYFRTAKELSNVLESFGILTKNSKLLDYGCAVGYLTDAFNTLGFSCSGYDISEWAVTTARQKNIPIVDIPDGEYNVLLCLDVLEHMTDSDISKMLLKCKTDFLVVRIPCSTDGGKTFHLDVSKKDPTHINCKNREIWIDFIKSHGFRVFLSLNCYTIYDSDGVICGVFLK